jgi:trehalose 6-phosphate synthase/phosphatase
VLQGDKVIEVRPAGVNKGGVVIGIADRDSDDSAWLVLGDDATDEEMFAMLPEGVVSIHVGSKPTRARFRLPDVSAVRTLLSRVIEQGSRGAAPPPRPRLEALPGSEPVD